MVTVAAAFNFNTQRDIAQENRRGAHDPRLPLTRLAARNLSYDPFPVSVPEGRG